MTDPSALLLELTARLGLVSCEYCGGTNWDVTATLIGCRGCGVVYDRVQVGLSPEAVEALERRCRELVQAERDPTAADRDTSSHWRPMAEAPRDGTEVALLFAREETVTFGVLSTWPRVRAAFFTGSDWSLPYYANNPPIGWAPLPAPPATVPLNTKEEENA